MDELLQLIRIALEWEPNHPGTRHLVQCDRHGVVVVVAVDTDNVCSRPFAGRWDRGRVHKLLWSLERDLIEQRERHPALTALACEWELPEEGETRWTSCAGSN